LIFFAYRLWIYIKQNKYIKAALEGINAVSAGLVLGVSLYLANSIELNFINAMVVIGTLVLLISEKIPTILILAFGLGLGYIF
jgi:chromate transporter